MIVKMAVADSNIEYVERLMKGLEKYDELSLSVYTDRRSLENALKTKRLDVLLFDPSLYDGQIALPQNTLGIVLYDEASGMPGGRGTFPMVSKYQRISRIYKKVLELYADVCGNIGIAEGKNRVGILAFYSPVGGCGKTTISLAAAVRLSWMGYRTFYINIEDIASEGFYLQQSEEKGMSDMVSCLGTEINFSVKLQGLLQNKTENLYYLNHFASPNDVYEIREEEIETLLNEINHTGLFDFIIVDMGVSLDGKTVKIFECADKIILIEKQDMISRCKLERFYSQMHIMNENKDKMLRVLNFRTGREKQANEAIPLVETIDMMQSPDSGQLVEAAARSNINQLIKALID